jgi:acyl-CoA thioester hydrolase
MNIETVKPALRDRETHQFWHRDIVRFGDLDRQGHVNNACFATFCESGRVAVLDGVIRPFLVTGDMFALATITIDFLREIYYPGEVEIGTHIARLGNSSLTFGQGLFNKGACAATAVATVVLLDPVTRRSKPFPAEVREHLAGLVGNEEL